MSITQDATVVPEGQTTTAGVSAPALLLPRGLSRRYRSRQETELRRVGQVWGLLWLNVLGSATGSILKIPHSVLQVITQGALVGALVLALMVNPKVRLRPNVLLSLYSLLAVLSVAMSIRFVSLGTDYRAFRLAGFLVVLWLLTPWWGRRDSVLLRNQMRILVVVIASVVVGLAVAPGKATGGGRLADVIWSVPPTQVAHYSAELAGLTVVMWICGLMRRRTALLIVVPTVAVLLLTHTRTALVGACAGLLVAGLSLFNGSRRVRRVFLAGILVVAIVGIPFSPTIYNYMTRGENASQLSSLTGRTSHWQIVLSEPRPETNKIFGSGMSNDFAGGQAIDSSWLSTYQDQGIVGDVIVGLMFLMLILAASFRPRGPARALALFLIVYCLVASFTETGMGQASQYAMDMTLAASMLIGPRAAKRGQVGML